MTNRLLIIIRLIGGGKFKYLYASLRRRWLYLFRRGYVERQLRRRSGGCSECGGTCCRKTMPWCRYLDAGRCLLYGGQPLFCRIFPIDERDQELCDVRGTCGYRFPNDENAVETARMKN